jgi:hypothetical protein
MNLLNLAHPITPKQREQIERMAGQPVAQVIDVRVQFDLEQPFVAQVVAMFDGLGITSERWQGEAWLVALPSLNYIAALVLAELHGRMGHFPAILRLRPVPGALVTEYEVAEIVNLEQVRQAARARR